MRSGRPSLIAALLVGIALLLAGWYYMSPRLAIARLTDREAAAERLVALYDRDRVRAAFKQQMSPQVDSYPPPWTKDVVLDALSNPRAIRAFVAEPYGEWQFAAAEGLPLEFAQEDPANVMPRLMEITDSWTFERSGIEAFTAMPSYRDDREGNSYRFEREGLGWRLVAIELTTKIR